MKEQFKIKDAEVRINDPGYKILSIDRASVFNSKVENPENINTSIFRELYIKGAVNLREIIKSSLDFSEIDNIITFIGEKGSGKTTILKSFMQSLQSECLGKILLNEYENISKVNFDILELIDLSYKLEKDSILSIVIFNIYKSFLSQNNIEDYSLKKELEDYFNKVFKELDIFLNNDVKGVFEMNTCFTIKESIDKLIKMYLNYCKKEYLVLSIDNISCLKDSDNIINELRKYFRCEKLIILMTIDKELLDDGRVVLDKVGYFNNYIYIEPINFLSTKLKVDADYFSNISINNGKNIFEQIQHILLKKFNYYIVSSENFNVLISSNIREFINFIVFINSLKEDAFKDESSIFKYFESLINKQLVSKKYIIILNSVLKCKIEELNKNLLILLSELIIDKSKSGNINSEIENESTYIIRNKYLIKEEKVCIGDIITSIEVLKKYKSNKEECKFIELLKTVYTIRLLIEYNLNAEKILKIIGKDYVGGYFKVTSSIDEFTKNVEINGRKSAEDIKEFFGFRKDLFTAVFEPCYDYNISYSRLIYEDINCFDKEEIYRQRYFKLKFLNVLSYSILNYLEIDKNIPQCVLCIINIDYWINILNFLNDKFNKDSIGENNFICKTMEYIKEIFTSNGFYLRNSTFEEDIKDHDHICCKDIDIDEKFIVDKEDIDFLQNLNNELNRAQYLYTYSV